MMPEWRAILPYPPSVNHLYTRTRGGWLSLSAEAAQYRAVIRATCGLQHLMDGAVTVEIDAYRPRNAGDLDNILKALLDSLQGVIYRDDKQVVQLVARRWTDRHNPRVEITVRQIPGDWERAV